MKPRAPRRLRIAAWIALAVALAAATLQGASVRWTMRYAFEAGPLSISLDAADGLAAIWVATKTGVMGSYDVGWHASRVSPAPDEGPLGRALGGSWRWVLPEGGNEVIPPHAHTVWRLPGIIEYESDPGMWADGGVARTLSWVLWPIPLIAGACAWWLFGAARRAQRRAMDRCVRCGYDRRGVAEEVACPECGARA